MTCRTLASLFGIVLFVAGVAGCGADNPVADASASPEPAIDRIAFARNGDIYLIGADGSGLELLATGGQLPVWSPRGDRLAFLSPPSAVAGGRATGAAYLDLHVTNADGSERINLTNGSTGPGGILGFSWSPDGRKLAFAAGGYLHVVGADDRNLTRLTRENQGDLGSIAPAAHSIAWSPDGTRLAFTNGNLNVVRVDGTDLRAIGEACGDAVAWSPSGVQLAVSCGRTSLYVINVDGTAATELTTGITGFDRLNSFAWSPDGSRVAFDTQRPREMWVAKADGSGVAALVQGRSPSWSPDGRRIAFACPAEGWQLCVANADGSAVQQITDATLGPIDSLSLSWSPAKR